MAGTVVRLGAWFGVGVFWLVLVVMVLPSGALVSDGWGVARPTGNAAGAGGETRSSGSASMVAAGDSSGDWAWASLASPPTSVSGSGLAAVASGTEALEYGGNASGNFLNSTQLFSLESNSWMPNYAVGASSPGPRAYMSMASDPSLNGGTAVLFGGETGPSQALANSSTWVFSLSTRTWSSTLKGGGPAPRADAAFAIDSARHTGLLFGGWNPDFRSMGVLTYSDTWRFNLTSDVWKDVTNNSTLSPPPLRGGRLVSYGNVFDLFGGCFPCSNRIWQYNLTTGQWAPLPPAAGSPPPRMDAVWAWDVGQDLGLLFGGTDGTTIFDDTYVYQPGPNAWAPVIDPEFPTARASAGSDWLATSADSALLVVGGAGANGSVQDAWRLSETANLTVFVNSTANGAPIPEAYVALQNGRTTEASALSNASGVAVLDGIPAGSSTLNASAPGFASHTQSVQIGSGTNVTENASLTPVPPATVDVQVLDAQSTPVQGAPVLLLAYGVLIASPPLQTNASGWANYSQVPAGPATIEAQVAGYRAAFVQTTFPSGQTLVEKLTLTALPGLDTLAIGIAQGLAVPLRGADIEVNGTSIGTTAANGWLNTTVNETGPVEVEGRVADFQPGFTNVSIPSVGTRIATLTLLGLPPGVLLLAVTNDENMTRISDANATVKSYLATPIGPVTQSGYANSSGDIAFSLIAGNYSFNVFAPGYAPFYSTSPVQVTSGNTTRIPVPLTPDQEATVHFIAIDKHTSLPIANANVSLNLRLVGSTGDSGWLNLTDVVPGVNVSVEVAANGYLTNLTRATFAQSEVLLRYQVNLTPLPHNNNTTKSGNYTGVLFDTDGAFPLWELLLIPILVAAAAALYLFVLRVPSVPGVDRARRPPDQDRPPP